MNAERLLELYDRVAEAPDAVPRLRRFVLDLAVRGKLVEQDPADEPAEELLSAVGKKGESTRSGARTEKSGCQHQLDGERMFELPAGWAWTTLGEVASVTMGQSPSGSTYNNSGQGVPLINGPVEFTPGPFGRTVVNQYTTEPTKFCDEGDFLICVRGSTTGRTNIARFRACIGRGVAAIHSLTDDSFLRLFLWRSREDIISMGRGIAFPSVSKKQLQGMRVPLPPAREQKRIVEKVDELMALCDRLEEARTTREATRDRLTTASLARLTAPDSDEQTFRSHARFALDAFPALTTRADQIKALRQTILNLAVRGKLVEQDPADEPASELLKRIKAEKARLINEGTIKARKIAARDQVELPRVAVPSSWQLASLGEISIKITDGAHKTPTYVNSGVPFVSVKDFSGGQLKLSGTRCIPESEHAVLYQRCDPRRGDILIGRIGTLGKAVLVDTDVEFSLFVSVGLIRFDHNNLEPEYFRHLLNSPVVEEQFDRIKIGGGTHTNKLNLGDLHTVMLPIPPLAEQRRIVVALDQLMTICDRLEEALSGANDRRRGLLDALLREALEPTRGELEVA